VDDSDVEVVDEGDDGLVFVFASDADAEHLAAVADGDFAGGVDAVAADSVMAASGRSFGCCFRQSGVGHCGCGAAQRAVRPLEVVDVNEGVELALKLADCVGSGLRSQPFLECLLESFDFSTLPQVVGSGVLLFNTQRYEQGFEAVTAAFAARESGGEVHGVV